MPDLNISTRKLNLAWSYVKPRAKEVTRKSLSLLRLVLCLNPFLHITVSQAIGPHNVLCFGKNKMVFNHFRMS